MNDNTKSSSKVVPFLTPALADALFAIFFYSIAGIFGQKLLGDGDTGYHIRAGEYIINTLSIPRLDMFSFISPPLSWTAHEWLSEVIMALLHSWFGMSGVVFFYAGLIALVYSLLFRMIRRLNGTILIALTIVLLAILSSMLHWLARPHIFSLLLMVVWYDLLDSYQYRGINRLYLLPLLMLLWVNLHGGFMSGFVLLGIYLTGNLCLSRFGANEDRTAAGRRWRQFLKTTLFCIAASLVNPLGYKILLFPFTLVTDRYMMDHVMEFLSPNFHEATILPFKVLLLLTIALLAVSRRRITLIQLGLLLFFMNLAVYSVRYITLYAIIAPPILVSVADQLLAGNSGRFFDWLRRKDAGIAEIDSEARGFLWPLCATIAVAFCMIYGGPPVTFDEKLKPVAAVEFMKREHIPGNMYDNDEFGDYIIYAAWPQYRVFIDGRLDMYGSQRLKEYMKVKNFDADWESVMKKYDMNWVIYDADAPLCRFLLTRSDWHLIYADKVANIFVRTTPLYGPLIRKYPAVKPVVPDPSPL
jgi:hypothetical protein